MKSITICLLCDGSSDFCLEDIIQWIVDRGNPDLAYRTVRALDLVPANGPLAARLSRVVALYAPDIIVCHRDAEGVGLEGRILEIIQSAKETGIEIPIVPAVPVRMLESWLLCDEAAIRHAADNANGIEKLNLPNPSRVERLADPKQVLFDALRVASGLGTNRLRKFNEQRARTRITGFMEDYAPLRRQRGFELFEQALLDSLPD